ncbi:MAG: hypothetical protein AAF808_15700 [Cyanobacteria bacterium P01_D01_bin.2]
MPALAMNSPYHRRRGPRKSWQITVLAGLLLALGSCRPATAPPSDEGLPAVEPDVSAAESVDSSSVSVPPPPPPNAYLAQLSPDAANQLVDLGIDIAVPTYLPPTMVLASYGAGEASEGPGGGPFYWLVYRDGQDRCFAIEYTSGGIGGISLENQESLELPLFGEGYSLYHGQFPNGAEENLSQPDLFTDWLAGTDGFYRLAGAGLINAQNYDQGDCSNITVDEAIAVAESLIYLPTDIRTLDLVTPATPDPASTSPE